MDDLIALCSTSSGEKIFELSLPSQPWQGLLSIPHSGKVVPEVFYPWLVPDKKGWHQDVDFSVHKLIHHQTLLEKGIVILKSNIHRIACDLNRSPEVAILNWTENSLGVPLVQAFPKPREIQALIQTYHQPYFTIIRHITRHTPSMIDLHSMPSRPTAYHLKKNPNQGQERPDFCLSYLEKEKSCSEPYIQSMKEKLQAHGYQVLINNPYVGGYITQFARTLVPNNIQIEIKRSLYMDEAKQTLKTSSEPLTEKLTQSLLAQFSLKDSA